MVLFASDNRMLLHFCPWPNYHIEVPQRMKVIAERMEDCDLAHRLKYIHSRKASEDELAMVHTQRYIEDIKSTVDMSDDDLEAFCTRYEDIYLNQQSFEASLLAAGCAIELTKQVFQKKTCGFASIRPPGHHASPDAGCGFCIFNNVALAAKHARSFGAQRVLIVDWDVHAGQGTQECIEDDEDIRLVSIHRFEHGTFWPNLEQSAVDSKFRNTINVPLNGTGFSDSDFLSIIQLVVLPLISDFRPDLILVSCGFDAALGDPEGEMSLTPACYGTMTRLLSNQGVPLALLLEGGYFLQSVAADAEYAIRALLGDDIPHIEWKPLHPELPPVLRKIFKNYSDDYPSLAIIDRVLSLISSSPPNSESIDEPEFRGSRTVSIPYATRGLYAERGTSVVQEFQDKLDDIVNSYTGEMKYKHVTMEIDNDESVAVEESDVETTRIRVHPNLYHIVCRLIALPINPLYVPDFPVDIAPPTSSQIASLADFLCQNKDSTTLGQLPIFKV